MSGNRESNPPNHPPRKEQTRTTRKKRRSSKRKVEARLPTRGAMLETALTPLIKLHRDGDQDALATIKDRCNSFVRKPDVGFGVQIVSDITNMALGEAHSRLEDQRVSAAVVAQEIRRAVEKHRQRERRARKAEKKSENALTNATLAKKGFEQTPEENMLRAEKSEKLRAIVSVISKSLLTALELLGDTPHDLMLESYGLRGSPIKYRGANFKYSTRNTRQQALRRARKAFGQNLTTLLQVEMQVNPSSEVKAALDLVSGDSLKDVLEYLGDQ